MARRRRNPEGNGLTAAVIAGLGLLLLGGKKAESAPMEEPMPTPPTPQPSSLPPEFTQEGGRFKPGSPEQVALFEAAAKIANLPVAWASNKELQRILGIESGGKVGVPNYLWAGWISKTTGKKVSIRQMWDTPSLWPPVWKVIREGKAKPSYTGIGSHAAGLGQLQPDNMQLFQPSGVKGVGIPIEEAVGMLRYIADRYGSPDVAGSVYGKLASYTHAITGKKRDKKFKEGY